MKYGDFSSLVQLGVGLHAGTALLQIYGEIGVQPLIRTLTRIRKLLEDGGVGDQSTVDNLDQLDTEFDIFRIQLFNEFKQYVIVNFAVAMVLIIILIVISYKADDFLYDAFSVIFVFISIFPALITLYTLWSNASRQLRPLKLRADALQRRALGMAGPSGRARTS
jgi:hypothetical protein